MFGILRQSIISSSRKPQQIFNALSFDGVDDRVIVADDPAFEQQTPTLEFWAYHNNQARSLDGGAGKGEVFGDERQVSYLLNFSNGNGAARISNESSTYGTGGASIDAQIWTHWAMTYDGSTLKLYKNGNVITTLSVSITLQNLSGDYSQFVIGGRSFDTTGDFIMDGNIAEVRVWNYPRSQSEIINNANVELTGNETGLVAYYPLDQGSGTTATDNAGTNDGTIHGATWIERDAFPELTQTQTYSDVILADNPVAYWRLDETSGTTANDETGNGNDGTYGGSPSLGEDPLIQSGTSVDFDGTDDGIETSDTPFDFGTSDFTIAGWIRPAVIGPFHTIAHHRDVESGSSTFGAGYIFGIRDTGVLASFVGDGSSSAEATSATALTAGTAYFATARIDRSAGTVEVFVDGSLDGTADISSVGDISAPDPLWLGRSGNEGDTAWDYTQGHLDEITVWDRALTVQEITDLYNAGTEN